MEQINAFCANPAVQKVYEALKDETDLTKITTNATLCAIARKAVIRLEAVPPEQVDYRGRDGRVYEQIPGREGYVEIRCGGDKADFTALMRAMKE